jgi:hypothetical protein
MLLLPLFLFLLLNKNKKGEERKGCYSTLRVKAPAQRGGCRLTLRVDRKPINYIKNIKFSKIN